VLCVLSGGNMPSIGSRRGPKLGRGKVGPKLGHTIQVGIVEVSDCIDVYLGIYERRNVI
jgi:hypothetical protein